MVLTPFWLSTDDNVFKCVFRSQCILSHFASARAIRLPIPHLWRVNASPTKPAANSRRKLTR